MKIFGVQAIDIRGLPNGVYSFEKGPEEVHDHVLLTGGVSTGKTRLLELIVAVRELISPTDEAIDQTPFIRRENRTSKATVSWLLTSEEQASIGSGSKVVSTEVIFGAKNAAEGVDPGIVYLLERYEHDDATPKLEYFSERRRLEFGGGEASLDESVQVTLRTTQSPRKFAWIEAFVAMLRDDEARAERFSAALEGLSRTASYDPRLHRFFSRGRATRNLRELSASEADAVMFASTAALVGLSQSVVLVDRPELHGLDPVRALAGLSALGKGNQLILASSSRALSAAFDGAIIQIDSDEHFHRGLG